MPRYSFLYSTGSFALWTLLLLPVSILLQDSASVARAQLASWAWPSHTFHCHVATLNLALFALSLSPPT